MDFCTLLETLFNKNVLCFVAPFHWYGKDMIYILFFTFSGPGGGGHSLYKGIRGCAAGMGYVFTSSGIYYGHQFKILSNLLVVCICYGHNI